MAKEVIETMINTAALALTAAGTNFLIVCCEAGNPRYWGFLLITFGAALEFAKYYGRSKKLWK